MNETQLSDCSTITCCLTPIQVFLDWLSSVSGAVMTVSNVWTVHDTLFCEVHCQH